MQLDSKQQGGIGLTVLVALAAIGWLTGTLDPYLAGIGLNRHPCVTVLGSTVCGDQAEQLQADLDRDLGRLDAQLEQLNTDLYKDCLRAAETSADYDQCRAFYGSSVVAP